MFGLFRNGIGRKPAAFELGPLERAVMEIVWNRPECSVHHVAATLARPLAYTTVMTTLDRLYKKGFLERSKAERAFVYSAKFSREEFERRKASGLVAELLAGSRQSNELLISCLVDAVEQHDESLLDELERKIQLKRKRNSRRKP